MAKKVEVDAKLLIVAIALLIVATVGSAFATYLIFGRGSTEEQATANETAVRRAMGPTYDVGEFTLNLTSLTNQMRFIRTKIVLEASDAKVVSELETRAPQVRDQLITLIRSRTIDELKSYEGMEVLRFDIIKSINGLLSKGEVSDVFFIDLILQ
ncbi:MAG: flagellar basal body-associated FliL family protein [Limnochordia bacterium]|jgi:flagellar FliL protein|nr:flagellar basal body-associated FliL family protein [Limnochordia bacterium]